ncbi:hypothetical protein ACFL6B_04165 [Thermodesulfobacteriota bacterium]
MANESPTKYQSIISDILSWKWIWVAVLAPPPIIIVFIVQFTVPIIDGDPWWHMAYGRYFIENRTLIPDHTIFTWSRADATSIYCAWLPEIFLYLLYKTGGLTAFYVLRYLCMSVFILVVWLYARKVGMIRHPLTWLFCLLGLLMSVNAGFIKPEIFSYVFICLTVLNWMYIKSSGDKAWKYCYLFPLIMLAWVNSHGAFIFGALFLLAMGVGEEMNALFSVNIALSYRTRRHLFIALFLAALAILITPYGLKYPSNLLHFLLDFNKQHYASVRAYDSIFSENKKYFHYVDYLIICSIILIALIIPRIKKRQFDWAIVLTNGFMIYLYILYTRSTYFWVPVFTLSAVYLLSFRPSFLWPESRKLKTAIRVVITCICLILSGRAVYDRIMRSYGYMWAGFGISYIQPVEETEFIQKYLSEYKIANDYNTGGYLIWKLGPEKKIFIDPRYFPFKKWYGEYLKFENGINIPNFLEKNPADVWCIQHLLNKPKTWFANSPDWKLAFYGPSSTLFVRSDIQLPEDAPRTGTGINDIKNFHQASQVLKFALDIKEWDSTKHILAGMKKRFRHKNQQKVVDAWQVLLNGILAYHLRDYIKAAQYLVEAKNNKIVWSDGTLLNAYLHIAVGHWNDKNSLAARKAVQSALNVNPKNALAVYNMGIIEWYVYDPSNEERKYENYLVEFLQGTEKNTGIPSISRQIAAAILNDQYNQRPPLLRPTPPPKYEPETIKDTYSEEIPLLPPPPGWR